MVDRQTWEMQLDQSLATLSQEISGYKCEKENDIDGHLSDLEKEKANLGLKLNEANGLKVKTLKADAEQKAKQIVEYKSLKKNLQTTEGVFHDELEIQKSQFVEKVKHLA